MHLSDLKPAERTGAALYRISKDLEKIADEFKEGDRRMDAIEEKFYRRLDEEVEKVEKLILKVNTLETKLIMICSIASTGITLLIHFILPLLKHA